MDAERFSGIKLDYLGLTGDHLPADRRHDLCETATAVQHASNRLARLPAAAQLERENRGFQID